MQKLLCHFFHSHRKMFFFFQNNNFDPKVLDSNPGQPLIPLCRNENFFLFEYFQRYKNHLFIFESFIYIFMIYLFFLFFLFFLIFSFFSFSLFMVVAFFPHSFSTFSFFQPVKNVFFYIYILSFKKNYLKILLFINFFHSSLPHFFFFLTFLTFFSTPFFLIFPQCFSFFFLNATIEPQTDVFGSLQLFSEAFNWPYHLDWINKNYF